MEKFSLAARLRAALQYAEAQARKGGMEYLHVVTIDSKPDPQPFRLVARPWQWERARRIVPAIENLAGFRPDYSGPRSYWETMPRGHDKTSFLARMLNWALGFSRRKLMVIAAAGDEDQAGLLTEAMQQEAELNAWLRDKLVFRERKVFGPGGSVKVVAADAATSFGLRGDWYVCDEVTHWKKSDFWVSLLSGRAKIPNAIFTILTNAGLIGSWQWEVKEFIKNDPEWCFWEAPGQLETWMSPEQIARDRLLLPPADARRLYDNEWIDPAEASGYLTRAEVMACEQIGRDLGLVYQTRGRPGIYYLGSIDYGPKRDRTVLAVMHQEPDTGRILVDRMDVWQGSREQSVQLAQVRDWIEEQRRNFPDFSLVLDKYQMEDIAQTYEHWIPVERFEPRGGKSNYEMAACLRSCIVNRLLAWYPGAGDIPRDGRLDTLADELCGLVLKQMVYGYRIDHEFTRHDDRAVALGMGCLMLLRQMKPAPWVPPASLDKPASDPGGIIEHLQKLRGGTQRPIYGIEKQGRR